MAQLRRMFVRPPKRRGKNPKRTGHKSDTFIKLWEAFGRACAYCQKPITFENATKDHLKPKAKGGSPGYKNVVPACQKCNVKKADNPAIHHLLQLGHPDPAEALARIDRIRFAVLCVRPRRKYAEG